MNGYQVFASLQALDATADIPVIFITGLGDSDEEETGLTLGARDYITKPFKAAIVKLRVRHQVQIINQLSTIKRLSMIDPLTGIPNRRCFDDRLPMEWSRAVRDNLPICLLLMDVDRFKNYNDTYGHLQGDVALHAIANLSAKMFERPGDFFARWGGEEFAVLLPNTDVNGGMYIGEQVREAVEKAVIPDADGTRTQLTISIGVNVHTPRLGSSTDSFIIGADKALYAAKQAGRNRVCLYDSALMDPCPRSSA
jgi:diguanylate cyclase (GGDEF)-like protein